MPPSGDPELLGLVWLEGRRPNNGFNRVRVLIGFESGFDRVLIGFNKVSGWILKVCRASLPQPRGSPTAECRITG